MRDIKIFVTHTPNSNNRQICGNALLHNVMAGAEYHKGDLPDGMYADNQGDNISLKNKSYCELTTQYWAWKNIDADYYGFFHYRRFLSFNEMYRAEESKWQTIEYDYLGEKEKKELCLNESDMRRMIQNYDFIIAKPIDVTRFQCRSVSDHYRRAEELYGKDLDLFVDLIKEKYPFLYDAVIHSLDDKWFYPCNMFIMRKELFQEYSYMLFELLEEFETRCDMSNYSRESRRTPGHLGERFAGIYYRYLKEQGKYHLTHTQVALVRHVEKEDVDVLLSDTEVIPVVLAADQKYVPILYCCIQSIVENVSPDRNYCIFIFHKDIQLDSQEMFQKHLTAENVSIVFVNVERMVHGYALEAKEHITTETFYRFLILDILGNYDKVVYLDSDMIVCRDVAELYDTDIGNHLIAATRDPDFSGQCNRKKSDMRVYCSKTLGLKNPFRYFQAGTLVFNVRKLRKVTTVKKLFEMADTGIYRFSDQDILNIVCRGRVKYLDMSWNVMFDCNHKRRDTVIRYAPYWIMDEYEEARIHPYIIHYAGFMKPWMRPGEDFGYVFWEVARRTPYYEQILAWTEHSVEMRAVKLANTRKILKRVLKPGSKTRVVLGKAYWRFFGERK